jgi:hypothetical protein
MEHGMAARTLELSKTATMTLVGGLEVEVCGR